jgi:hypothetical protein
VRQPSDCQFVPACEGIFIARRLTTFIFASGIIATALAASLDQASATTTVEGKPDAVLLTAEDAPIGEVLAALSVKFGLIYTPTSNLNRTVGGTYSGTLQQVLGRILDGCDYIASYSGDKIELRILGSSELIARPSSPLPQASVTAASAIVGQHTPGPVR